MPTTFLPASSNPVHLLRALLRECTYLPDPASRSVLAPYIVGRFRKYHPPATEWERRRSNYPPSPRRKATLITAARRGLSQLIRANQGELKSLMRVLWITYGRVGATRRALVAGLAQPEAPWPIGARGRKDLTQWPAMSGPLTTVVRSQIREVLPRTQRGMLKTANPKIPKQNIWLRPLPKKRERNLRWEFYSHVLNQVMPPLPEHEWTRLRDLTNGTERWSGPVPRRSRLVENQPLLHEELLSRRLDQQRFVLNSPERARHLTPRLMRRLWSKVFTRCSVMQNDGPGTEERISWGNSALESKKLRPVQADEIEMFFSPLKQQETHRRASSV